MNIQTPVEIDFLDMAATSKVRDAIVERVAQLEQLCGRLTACRVALKGPGARHR